MNVSLAVNIFLLVVKIYAFWASRSKAILASAADSLVDIASQLVIAYAEYKASTHCPLDPSRWAFIISVYCVLQTQEGSPLSESSNELLNFK